MRIVSAFLGFVLQWLMILPMVFAFPPPALAGAAAEGLKALAGLKGAERTARLTEEAKKEGKLVFYGSLGIDASRPLLEKFRKSHPYLTIDHYRSGEAGIYNKVANEAAGGLHAVDVIESLPGTAYSLILKGLVAPYRSPEARAMRPEFVDPKHVWHSYSYLVIALGYNKTKVKDNQAPRSYAALLDPRWKGNQISLDTEDADIFGILLDIWGEEQGLKYFRRLAKQDLMFRRGHTLQTQLLVAGESAVAPWLYSHRPLQMMGKEAPIGLVFLEPVISLPKMVMLADKAPHPYAAALFIDWILSEKGQSHTGMVMGRSPVRKGEEQKYKELDGLNTRPITPELLGPNYNRYVELYRRIFNLK